MSLNKLEREVLTDSMLKIQSIQASLGQIEDSKILDADEIQNCLDTASRSFQLALREEVPKKNVKR